jgi:hypothetical protein
LNPNKQPAKKCELFVLIGPFFLQKIAERFQRAKQKTQTQTQTQTQSNATAQLKTYAANCLGCCHFQRCLLVQFGIRVMCGGFGIAYFYGKHPCRLARLILKRINTASLLPALQE